MKFMSVSQCKILLVKVEVGHGVLKLSLGVIKFLKEPAELMLLIPVSLILFQRMELLRNTRSQKRTLKKPMLIKIGMQFSKREGLLRTISRFQVGMQPKHIYLVTEDFVKLVLFATLFMIEIILD